jgi:hypothetical protein
MKTDKLTTSMGLSPSSEAGKGAATQKAPSTVRNPKVHHRIYNSLPLFPILSQTIPLHIVTSYFIKIHFNIVLIYAYAFQVVYFLQCFLPKFCNNFYTLAYVLHVRPTSTSLIL